METFLGLVLVVIMHRHRNQGLVLSELGGYLKRADQAPAGTKRISRLLHSPKWSAEMIETYLWTQADEQVDDLASAGQAVLVVWDESVIEKPESLQAGILVNSGFLDLSVLFEHLFSGNRFQCRGFLGVQAVGPPRSTAGRGGSAGWQR